MDTMLTVEEVADILKVQPLTVRQMFREKRLRGFKIGKAWRITLATLEEDIAAMSGHPAPSTSQPAPLLATTPLEAPQLPGPPPVTHLEKTDGDITSAKAAPVSHVILENTAIPSEETPSPAEESAPEAAATITNSSEDSDPDTEETSETPRKRRKATPEVSDDQQLLF